MTNVPACPAQPQRSDCRSGWAFGLRTMPRLESDVPNDVTVYLVEEDFGQHGRAFLETDTAEADRETIVRNFISGQYDSALRVIAFNTTEGWSRDVSEDIANDILDRAHDADETLTDGTRRFIDRHVTPGEKRPPQGTARSGRRHARFMLAQHVADRAGLPLARDVAEAALRSAPLRQAHAAAHVGGPRRFAKGADVLVLTDLEGQIAHPVRDAAADRRRQQRGFELALGHRGILSYNAATKNPAEAGP